MLSNLARAVSSEAFANLCRRVDKAVCKASDAHTKGATRARARHDLHEALEREPKDVAEHTKSHEEPHEDATDRAFGPAERAHFMLILVVSRLVIATFELGLDLLDLLVVRGNNHNLVNNSHLGSSQDRGGGSVQCLCFVLRETKRLLPW